MGRGQIHQGMSMKGSSGETPIIRLCLLKTDHHFRNGNVEGLGVYTSARSKTTYIGKFIKNHFIKEKL